MLFHRSRPTQEAGRSKKAKRGGHRKMFIEALEARRVFTASASGFQGLLANADDFKGVGGVSAFTNLKFSDVAFNDGAVTVESDGSLKVQQSGLYSVKGQFDFVANGSFLHLPAVIKVNDTVVQQPVAAALPLNWNQLDFDATLDLVAGDTVKIQARPDSIDDIHNGLSSTLSITGFGATDSSTATKGHRGLLTNALTFNGTGGNTQYANLVFGDLKVKDGAVTWQTDGSYKVEQSGLYSVEGHFDVKASSALSHVDAHITVNGVLQQVPIAARNGDRLTGVHFDTTLKLNAGDFLRIQASPAAIDAIDNGVFSSLSITAFNTVGSSHPVKGYRASLKNAADFNGAGDTTAFTNLAYGNVLFNDGAVAVQEDGSLVVQQSGLYSVEGQFDFVANANSPYVDAGVTVNGIARQKSLAAKYVNGPNQLNFDTTLKLFTGDVLRVQAKPSAIDTINASGFSTLSILAWNGLQNQQPTDLVVSPGVVVEGSLGGTAVGTLSSTDPDVGDAFTYSLVAGTGSTDNGLFVIDGNTIRTAADTVIDYETKDAYSVRVRTTDQGGLWAEKQLAIAVANQSPSSPVDGDAAVNSVPEGSLTGTLVGITVQALDPHNSPVSYSLIDNAGGRFAINSITGVVSVADSGLLNGPDSHVIKAQASDSAGATSLQEFTVAVDSVAPTAKLQAGPVVAYGQSSTVSFTDAFDPSVSDATAGLRYAFALEAETLATATYATGSVLPSASFGLNAGTSIVYARIMDQNGGFTQYTVDVMVTRAILTGNATSQDALNMAKQGELHITVKDIHGFVNNESVDVFLSNASFWISVAGKRYEFMPTSLTKLSDSSIAISYVLKDSMLKAELADTLATATSAGTAIQAGFMMESLNYSLLDDDLARLFSTAR